jgi:hypothetical protein
MLPEAVPADASQKNGWEKVAWVIWLAALGAVLCRVLLTPSDWQSVYPVYHTAGFNWRAGQSLYLFPGDLVVKPQYRYSPAAAALQSPFTFLPERVASLLWRLLNVVVYLGAFVWWLRTSVPRRLGSGEVAALLLLILPISLGSINLGQANVLIIGLLLATVAATANGRWALAGGCSALGGFLKIYPLALGMLLAVIYPRRFLPWFVLALAIFFTLPFAFQDAHYVAGQYSEWIRNLLVDDHSDWSTTPGSRDLRLLLTVVGPTPGHRVYLALQLVGAAGCAVLAMALRRRGWSKERLLTCLLAVASCWMVLLGPGIESCTYILVAPTLAWMLVEAFVEPAPLVVRSLLLVSYGLLLAAIVATWFPNGTRTVHAYGLHPLAALLLLAAVLLQEYRWFAQLRSELSLSGEGGIAVGAT